MKIKIFISFVVAIIGLMTTEVLGHASSVEAMKNKEKEATENQLSPGKQSAMEIIFNNHTYHFDREDLSLFGEAVRKTLEKYSHNTNDPNHSTIKLLKKISNKIEKTVKGNAIKQFSIDRRYEYSNLEYLILFTLQFTAFASGAFIGYREGALAVIEQLSINLLRRS